MEDKKKNEVKSINIKIDKNKEPNKGNIVI
jgi:hypothetical protein